MGGPRARIGSAPDESRTTDMATTEKGSKTDSHRDEPVTIPLDPEVALRALLIVKPDGDDDDREPDEGRDG
jgi:hypothetical protein